MMIKMHLDSLAWGKQTGHVFHWFFWGRLEQGPFIDHAPTCILHIILEYLADL